MEKKSEINAGKARSMLMKICSTKEMCRNDLEKKMDRWGLDSTEQGKILKYLEKEGFYSDRRFAESYINDKFRLMKWGKVKIKYALRAKSMIVKSNCTKYLSDLPYMEFTADQYLFLARSRKNILEASELYAGACKIQTSDPPLCRKSMVMSLEKIIESRQDLELLRNSQKLLWLKENKIYWYDEAVHYYQQHINDFMEVEKLLETAIADFDKVHSLPSPASIRLSVISKAGRYFQYWLMCGPFHIDSFPGPKPDFLLPLGGEEKVAPFPGLSFIGADGNDYIWEKFDFPQGSTIDLKMPSFIWSKASGESNSATLPSSNTSTLSLSMTITRETN